VVRTEGMSRLPEKLSCLQPENLCQMGRSSVPEVSVLPSTQLCRGFPAGSDVEGQGKFVQNMIIL